MHMRVCMNVCMSMNLYIYVRALSFLKIITLKHGRETTSLSMNKQKVDLHE